MKVLHLYLTLTCEYTLIICACLKYIFKIEAFEVLCFPAVVHLINAHLLNLYPSLILKSFKSSKLQWF